MITAQNGIPVLLPSLDIEALAPLDEAARLIENADDLIFISVNAVNFALKAFNGKMPLSKQTRIAAIGSATASALNATGLAADIVPTSTFNSEALLSLPLYSEMNGRCVVIIKGQGGRDLLFRGLSERGAQVSEVAVYRRVVPQSDPQPVLDMLAQRQLDAATATSEEALANLLAILGDTGSKALQSLPLATISPRLQQCAAQWGFSRAVAANLPSDEAIVDTLNQLLNEETSGRSN